VQFKQINPQYINLPGINPRKDARLPLTFTTLWSYFQLDLQPRTLLASELTNSTASVINVKLDGAHIPGSPFKPNYRANSNINMTNARAVRHRTVFSATQSADTRPAIFWTWDHFPDEFWNVQIEPEAILDSLQMSDVVLMKDHSNKVCLCGRPLPPPLPGVFIV
jgi:hypothetical protein